MSAPVVSSSTIPKNRRKRHRNSNRGRITHNRISSRPPVTTTHNSNSTSNSISHSNINHSTNSISSSIGRRPAATGSSTIIIPSVVRRFPETIRQRPKRDSRRHRRRSNTTVTTTRTPVTTRSTVSNDSSRRRCRQVATTAVPPRPAATSIRVPVARKIAPPRTAPGQVAPKAPAVAYSPTNGCTA